MKIQEIEVSDRLEVLQRVDALENMLGWMMLGVKDSDVQLNIFSDGEVSADVTGGLDIISSDAFDEIIEIRKKIMEEK